ncbi:MAG: enoyl-CoA hydratase [Chloroflexota bacterium]
MSKTPILLEKKDSIAIVTLNRPKAMNALSKAMRDGLIDVFSNLHADPDVRVVVFTGNGRAFCAGLDLKEMEEGGLSTADLGTNAPFIKIMAEFDRPIIGAINGFAITGGFELALMSDFMIAAESAKFADTHARVGIVPGWGLSQKLPRIIGIQRAKEMSFTGNFIDAHTAERWGLVNRVVPDEALLPVALELANDITSTNRDVLAEIKSLIDTGYGNTLETGMEIESYRSQGWAKKMDTSTMGETRKAVQARGRQQ